MIIKISNTDAYTSIISLLCYATSPDNADHVFKKYLTCTDRHLYGYKSNGTIVGVIGVKTFVPYCEILHISVAPHCRGQRIGSQLIDFVVQRHIPYKIIAETDKEAVDFYKRYGFSIASLGEKYAGVERFLCEYRLTEKN